jgi:DNA-binding transcriptional regulator YdaS (Cro superfamily)
MNTKEIIKTLGGSAAVGRYLGIRSQAISLWIRTDRIPAERVPSLVRMSNGLVSANTMRPDVDWDAIACKCVKHG